MTALLGRRLAVGALAAAAALLSACAGVPSSSSPQIVQSVPAQPIAVQAIGPVDGADPRAIVRGFLNNNATDDVHHAGAKAFLTKEAKNQWQDNSGTQIIDSPQIGNFDNNSVTVSGRLIGTIDQAGVYSPSLPGDGQGVRGTLVQVPIGLARVDGEWRIDKPPTGLIIDSGQFPAYYSQYFVYFYDQAQQLFVPDARYSSLRDPAQLDTWLMTQLIGQPRSSLSTDLPSIQNPAQIKVELGPVLRVEIPGASQLDSETQNRMAQQVAVTLDQVDKGAEMMITDGGRGVTIPQVGGTRFTAAQFPGATSLANNDPALYYIYRGGVVDAAGKPLAGGIGSGRYGLTSVALATYVSTPQLLVAATSGKSSSAKLLVGQTGGELKQTPITGALSRPAWVPNSDEVWVGDGKKIYRSTSTGGMSQVQFTAETGTVAGQIIALRFSPEGARVALVIKADDGTSQVWIGDIVRSGDAVRVGGLIPISPLGIAVTDVAWNDAFKLFAIGHEISSDEGGVFEVQCDGSVWTPRGIGTLPQDPDSISVAENVNASVSAGGTVWQQHGGTWISPTGSGTSYGTNPVYLE